MSQGIFIFILDKLLQFTVFMMKSTENMEILIHGSTALKFLIIYPWEPLSTTKYSVFMED